MSLIKAAGAGEQSTGFYKHLLDQSLKFNDDDSQYLTRTPASAGNRRTFTFSCWVKRGNLGIDTGIFQQRNDANTSQQFLLQFRSGNNLRLLDQPGSGGNSMLLDTNALFRDASAWYHIVAAVDTTDGTAADRAKLYVNGERITSFASTTNYSTQNYDTSVNNTVRALIGVQRPNSSATLNSYFDGHIAEVNLIDGTALTAASFGETKDGIWIPKDTSGLTFGTNGFHLTFKDDVVSEGFNTVTYSGTGAAQSISGLGFDPDFVWIKERSSTSAHILSNSVAGPTKNLQSNNTDSEATDSNKISSFDGDGFSVGTSGAVNADGDTYVGWCWEAGGAPTADNSASAGATPTAGSVKIDGSNLGSALAGSIAATRLSANTSKGFSIGTFTKGSGTETVAHGLGAAPDWLLVKRRNGTGSWAVYHSGNTANPETDYLRLNSTNGTADDATFWGDTAPTSTVFSIGSAFNSGETLVFYAWTDITGYSSFGSYTGSGSNGKEITTGFAPAWILIKRYDADSEDWVLYDNTRNPVNLSGNEDVLRPNTSGAEASYGSIDFDSTGFTIQTTGGAFNADGGTYIYMAFADTREAAFFKDVTTNGNHFTPVNLDYRDSVPDTPTNNFATLNPLDAYNTGGVFSEGNLKWTIGGADGASRSTHVMTAGKWYVEFLSNNDYIGVVSGNASIVNMNGTQTVYYAQDGTKRVNGSSSSYGASYADGDIIGIALDLDASTQTVTFYKNNASQGSLNLTDVGNEGYSVSCGSGSGSTNATANFGQDSSFSGAKATANSNADGNGFGSFAYAPPSGYLALCSQNLPDVDIIDGTDNFNTVLYTGDGSESDNDISGVGFSPDFIWIKQRGGTTDHQLVNTVAGITKTLISNATDAEYTDAPRVNSVSSDGFQVFESAQTNVNNGTFAAWNWLAGTAFSNDASATSVGTIDSSGQVNTKAGFSITGYTATGTAGTIAHGLSAAPEFIIVKHRGQGGTGWPVYYGDNTDYKLLNSTSATIDSAQAWNDTSPTSTVFSVGANGGDTNNSNGAATIAYCFHSVEGYSKVGSYTGNGNANGPFVFTGFRPAFILLASLTGTNNWSMYDNKRDIDNPVREYIIPNSAEAAGATDTVDFLSNGFKVRNAGAYINTSGTTYIYLAFAEQPFKFANAR